MTHPGEVALSELDVVGHIGRGRLGRVDRVRRDGGDTTLALKRVRAEARSIHGIEWRFDAEAQRLVRAAHRNVIGVLGTGTDESGLPMTLLEYADGGSLAQRRAAIDPRGQRPDDVMRLVDHLAAGLDSFHRVGLTHGDVNPSNVAIADITDASVGLLGPDARAVLIDPSVSSESAVPAGPWVEHGTPGYRRDEFRQNANDADDPTIDVYGATATVWFAVTGQAPPGGAELIDAIRSTPRHWGVALSAGFGLDSRRPITSMHRWSEVMLGALAVDTENSTAA